MFKYGSDFMDKMLICICENDPSTVVFLQQECRKFYENKRDKIEFIVYDNGESLLKNKNDFDLIFLDINLNGLNGLDAAIQLREYNQNSQIIVISAYKSYKSSAYAAHVFDFIDKPISTIRLQDVLADLEMYFSNHNFSKSIYFNSNGDMYKIDIKDILYLEVVNRKLRLVLEKEEYNFYAKLSEYQNVLLENGFGIPHRSCIVNFEKIKMVGKDYVTMVNGDHIAIARPRNKKFKSDYTRYISEYLFEKGEK